MKISLRIQSKISIAYAKGFFLALSSRESRELEKAYADFKVFLDSMGGEGSELYKKLVSPLISISDRLEIVKKACTGLDGMLSEFLGVLVEKGRFDKVYEIYDACIMLKDEKDGVARGEIRIAKKPDAEKQKEIVGSLSGITGKRIKAEFIEDESIIAGFTALIGTHYVDYSLLSHLEQMETELNRS